MSKLGEKFNQVRQQINKLLDELEYEEKQENFEFYFDNLIPFLEGAEDKDCQINLNGVEYYVMEFCINNNFRLIWNPGCTKKLPVPGQFYATVILCDKDGNVYNGIFLLSGKGYKLKLVNKE
jgi:hypothetical protein